MSKRTKKVGNTGWMGPRYGIRIRRRVLDIDRAREGAAPCPKCSTVTVAQRGHGEAALRTRSISTTRRRIRIP